MSPEAEDLRARALTAVANASDGEALAAVERSFLGKGGPRAPRP